MCNSIGKNIDMYIINYNTYQKSIEYVYAYNCTVQLAIIDRVIVTNYVA